MCFMVHWHRLCSECGEEDVFSQEVVHCPTIKDAGFDDGMVDCVAKNKIFYANSAPYLCESVWAKILLANKVLVNILDVEW